MRLYFLRSQSMRGALFAIDRRIRHAPPAVDSCADVRSSMRSAVVMLPLLCQQQPNVTRIATPETARENVLLEYFVKALKLRCLY